MPRGASEGYMKKWIYFTLTAVTVGLSGCGKKDDGGGDVGAVPMAWPGAGVCQQAGEIYTQYGCLQQGICQPGQGQYGQTCVQGTQPPPGFIAGGGSGVGAQISGQLQVIRPRSFEQLLKFYGACRNYGGFSIGFNGFHSYSVKCRDFTYDGEIQIQLSARVDGAPAQVQIRGFGPNGQPTAPVNVPMIYQAINGNQGFTLYDRGNFNSPTPRIRVTSENGILTPGQAELVISFENRVFATSNLGRFF